MKPITFIGPSLDNLKGFPSKAKKEAGHQLDRVQRGLEPVNWKPMNDVGSGVKEIRISEEGAYRVLYVAKYQDAVYVLHAFQKKTQKTSKTDIDIAKKAYKAIKE